MKPKHVAFSGLGTVVTIILIIAYYWFIAPANSTPKTSGGLTPDAGSIINVPPTTSSSGGGGAVLPGAPGALPNMAQKPQPKQLASFQGCPPEGDGSDPALNQLKNRVDEGNYIPVAFDAVAQLSWPQAIERKKRADWSSADTAAIAKYEGIPISIEGYLYGAREEGPESPNCHGADLPMHDFHIWLTKSAGDSNSGSIVVETTPRVRANHSTWTVKALTQIAKGEQRVRISGWLMMDPEHPDQVTKTRGTIWEIHPIMKIEVQQGGTWQTF
ncbi:MAG: hypothetical protein WCF84_24265 [Anaerolineae bacterium]